MLPYKTLYKVKPMVNGWKGQLLSAEMMYKRIHMSKLISKILNKKTIFEPECFSFKSMFRASRNYGYTYFYNIMKIVHPLLMDESVECHIPYQNIQFISLIMLAIF